ncbi:hypothetical protein SNEBB_009431, partial [Seison nebaliae]
MNFVTAKGTTDVREKQKRKTALSPMVMGILGAILIAAIIAGIAVGIAAALDDDDNNNTSADETTAATVETSTTSTANTTEAGTQRILPEDERFATVESQFNADFTDNPACEDGKQALAEALAKEMDDNIEGQANGACVSPDVKEELFEAVMSGNTEQLVDIMKQTIEAAGAGSVLSAIDTDTLETAEPVVQSEDEADTITGTTSGLIAPAVAPTSTAAAGATTTSAGTQRILPEDERFATVESQFNADFTDNAACEDGKQALAEALAKEMDDNIEGQANGACVSPD